MKLRYNVITDFNGIVIFEPDRLIQFWGGQIQEGTDLYTHFMSSDDGDEVINRGIIIPILAITDAGYGVEFYINEKSDRAPKEIVFENGIYPLHVKSRLVLADLAVLKEWIENLGWIFVDVPRGYYGVIIRGFAHENRKGHIVDCGYEAILESKRSLPKYTATQEANCQVLIPHRLARPHRAGKGRKS